MPWPKSGLAVTVPTSPVESLFAQTQITDEAALTAGRADDLRVEMLVAEGDRVAQGQPVLRMRHHPRVLLTAPMPAEVASIDLGPGRRLSTVRFFHEPAAGRHTHDPRAAAQDDDALRQLLQGAGLWPAFRSRPFGHAPRTDEAPRAIVVMGLDTRPLAPDPRDALQDREDGLRAGLGALLRLTEGPVMLCQDTGPALIDDAPERLQAVKTEPVHPWGLAGLQVHRLAPATPAAPVWDIHAEDAAVIGDLLLTGQVPETRLVSVAGSAMTAARLVRCQPGADLRGLAYAHLQPGQHRILTGSALGGREARWLGARDRQATVMDTGVPQRRQSHWFLGALSRAARPMPLIPTAALDHALGGALPVMAFLRALSAGDAETFTRLGGLCFLPEDLELVDYITGAEPRATGLLAALLARIEAEQGA